MDKQSEQYLHEIIKALKPWELLIFPRDNWPIFKWKWEYWSPKWHGKWVFENWVVLEWERNDLSPYWAWKLKISDWNEYKGEWKDWVLETEIWLTINMVNLDKDFLIVQKKEDWKFLMYEWNPIREKEKNDLNKERSDEDIRKYCEAHPWQNYEQIKAEIEWAKNL